VKYLLDINVILAAAWANHPQFATADVWLAGKSVVVCPMVELGFLRISANRKAIGVPMKDARKALHRFLIETKATRIPDDLPALESSSETAEQVTDHYLAALADRHGFKLATMDGGIHHPAVEQIKTRAEDS
jgi:predicted nucleic acid-binding protein